MSSKLKKRYMTDEGKKKIMEKRKLLGYCQKDIARLLDISETSYNFKETGRRDWKNNERVKLIKYLHIDKDEEELIFG